MTSLRRYEGYLLIDNRLSGGGLTEAPVYTCSHCQRGILANPLRTRERHYCPTCDHYICDDCKAKQIAAGGGSCKPFKEILQEVAEAADKGLPPSSIIVLPT